MKVRSEKLLTQTEKGVVGKLAGVPKNSVEEMGPVNWSRKMSTQHPQHQSEFFALPLVFPPQSRKLDVNYGKADISVNLVFLSP